MHYGPTRERPIKLCRIVGYEGGLVHCGWLTIKESKEEKLKKRIISFLNLEAVKFVPTRYLPIKAHRVWRQQKGVAGEERAADNQKGTFLYLAHPVVMSRMTRNSEDGENKEM